MKTQHGIWEIKLHDKNKTTSFSIYKSVTGEPCNFKMYTHIQCNITAYVTDLHFADVTHISKMINLHLSHLEETK
jgi:hypothetical protein